MKELNDTEHKTNFYETMYDYVKDADISYYEWSIGNDNVPPTITKEFFPMSHPDLNVDYDNPIEHGGKTYIPVCWGENEWSAVLESAINGGCWVRYIPGNPGCSYVSDGTVYPSEKAAKRGR